MSSSFHAGSDMFKISHLNPLIRVPVVFTKLFCFPPADKTSSLVFLSAFKTTSGMFHFSFLWAVLLSFSFYPGNIFYSSVPKPSSRAHSVFPDSDHATLLSFFPPICLWFRFDQRSACFCSSCRKACFSISFLNSPCLLLSSSVCWPHSATRCWSNTATAFAFWMVERRWAMTTTVLPDDWVRGEPDNERSRIWGEEEGHRL